MKYYLFWLAEKLNTQLKCSICYKKNMTLQRFVFCGWFFFFLLLRNKPVTGFCQSLVDLADVHRHFRGIYACVNLIHMFMYDLKSQQICIMNISEKTPEEFSQLWAD